MRTLIGIVVIAVGCALAWVWFSTTEPLPTVAVDAPSATNANSAAPSEKFARDADGKNTAAAVEPGREARVGDTTVVDTQPATNPPVWTIRVVEAETNAPIAGARVWLVPRARLAQTPWPGQVGLVDDPLAILQQEPPIGTSRADGTIDVAITSAKDLLCAAAPGRFGAETADARPGSIANVDRVQQLRLHRDASLRVQVVDDGGTPRSFVPVELVVWQRGNSDSTPSTVHRTLPDAGTGLATIPHARWRLAGGGHPYFTDLGVYAVRPDIEFADFEPVHIDERHLAGEVLRLVVPPCSPIRVRLLQHDRTPWPYEGVAEVQTAAARWDGSDSHPLKRGEALFDAVGVAPPIGVRVRARDPRFASIDVSSPGNRTPWVETLLVAQLPKPGEGRPVLFGRVLDANGAPVSSTEFFVMPAEISAAFGEYPRFTTSSDGRFEVPYSDTTLPPQRALVRTDPTRGRNGFDPRETAAFGLPSPLSIGRHDLGDLRLTPTPLLVGGRVVSASGDPVDGVEIAVQLPGDPNAKAKEHRAPHSLHKVTDEGGSFRVHSFEKPAVVRVSALNDDSYVPPFDVASGRDDVVIAWPKPAWIRGRLILDAGVPPSKLLVYARKADGGVGVRGSQRIASGKVLDDGRFEIKVDDSDPRTIRIQRPGTGKALAEVKEVTPSEQPPGEPFTPCDARLDPLDLRGLVRLVRGRVLDADERPIERAFAHEENHASVTTDADGRFELVTTNPALELTIGAAQYRSVRVAANLNDIVVHLREPATRVVARLPDALVLDAFHEFVVWIEDPRRPAQQRMIADERVAEGVATLYVHSLGAYVVHILAAPKSGVRVTVPDVDVPIDVKDASPIELMLPLTQAQLDAIAKPATGK